jgi:hypothetical protein
MAEKVPLIQNKKMDADIAVSGLKQIKPPALVYNVTIELDPKVFKKVKNDSLMISEFHKAAGQSCARGLERPRLTWIRRRLVARVFEKKPPNWQRQDH